MTDAVSTEPPAQEVRIVIGALMVVMLLSAAAFLAVQSDASLTRADLDGKRAYAAAQSGMQAYLYSLNVNASNSTWWETCSNDKSNGGAGTPVAVPGATTGATYSYTPVPANGATACSATDPVGSAIGVSVTLNAVPDVPMEIATSPSRSPRPRAAAMLTPVPAPRSDWRIELPVDEHLTLDDRLLPTGGRTPAGDLDGPLGERTFDDLFTLRDGAFSVTGGGLRVELRECCVRLRDGEGTDLLAKGRVDVWDGSDAVEQRADIEPRATHQDR